MQISPEILMRGKKGLHHKPDADLTASAARNLKLKRYRADEREDSLSISSSSGSDKHHPYLTEQEFEKSAYTLNRDKCLYTVRWCEENTWKLLQRIQLEYPDDFPNSYAVFISNEKTSVTLWNARSAHRGECVYWEYHVLAVIKGKDGGVSVAYDFDSRSSFPSHFSDYFQTTFRARVEHFPKALERKFRIVPAKLLIENFSDRREDCEAAPPPWPPITIEGVGNNLNYFVDIMHQDFFGNVVDEEGLAAFFGHIALEPQQDPDSHLVFPS